MQATSGRSLFDKEALSYPEVTPPGARGRVGVRKLELLHPNFLVRAAICSHTLPPSIRSRYRRAPWLPKSLSIALAGCDGFPAQGLFAICSICPHLVFRVLHAPPPFRCLSGA
jgi:hypothetical protein